MQAVNKLSSARGWELAALAVIGVSGPVSFNYILFKPQVEVFWDSKVSPCHLALLQPDGSALQSLHCDLWRWLSSMLHCH